MFGWFRKKQKQDSNLMEFLEAENKLLREGWHIWCHTPPHNIESVYARRTLDDNVQIIYPAKLHPYFNVANLWWLPHYGEIDVNSNRLLN